MAHGYVIAHIHVTHPEKYPEYMKKVNGIVEKFGGEFLVRGGRAEFFEGTPPGERVVVARFPSYEKALEWYHSDDYAEAKALRMAASTSVQTIVEGI